MLKFPQKMKLPVNPYWLFSPFLLIYTGIIIVFQHDRIWGDEARYYSLAQNLLHGFYSPPAPYVDFANGPGYPLLLAPFIAIHLPLIYIKLLNGIFLYLSVIFLFKTLRLFVSLRIALILSLFWACYYNAYEALPFMFTEPFTIFLITSALLCLVRVFSKEDSSAKTKYIFLSGVVLGYLALTKVVFGYVLLFVLIGALLLWMKYRYSSNYKKLVLVIAVAFITTAPYLIYTYKLTGKVFYWATSSGNNLYWMTSFNEAEYGSWFPDPSTDWNTFPGGDKNNQYTGGQFNLKNRNNRITGAEDSIRKYHMQDFEEINKYNGVEKDDAFKRIAFRNIRMHPVKYLKNCLTNIGRMLFNFPFSYSVQKPGTLLRLPLSIVMVALMFFCIIPTLINWKSLPFVVRFELMFVFVYLGGCTLECAEIRMFTLIVPVLLVWLGLIIHLSLKIRLRFKI